MLSADLFFGVICFQLLFVFIQWFTFRRQEYGYYVLYIFCMLDYCAENNIHADVEVIPIQQIDTAYERMLKGDVKYRFVIDMASLQ